ncbi:hypothetical protein [uncultured Cohaesibacter sp.]|uniref:hypothetical protein n=1 Tax=uncultured Cohaesibacter sp. TaxID=1002546 RepID=UPI0029313021|nr:hypothetical protein [uncultured Cohaesibacter sp.]
MQNRLPKLGSVPSAIVFLCLCAPVASNAAGNECLRMRIEASGIAENLTGDVPDESRSARARAAAMFTWHKEAEKLAGVDYADFEKAQNPEIICNPMFRHVTSPYRCVITATPCR